MRIFQFTVILLSLCSPFNIEAASLVISIQTTAGIAVEDAVITLTSKNKKPVFNSQKRIYIVDQIDKTFVPHVKVIPTGSKVNFPNKDNIRHHVYSFSKSKKFELPLYKGTPAKPITFDKAGVVVLGCNIHDWMRGYIYVSATPFFGQTDKSGSVTISNIPAGEYSLLIWHPQITSNNKTDDRLVSFSKNDTKHMSAQIELKPLIKIRRAPTFSRRNY